MNPDRSTRQHRLAVAVAAVVDVSALWYLAPLEYAAGQAIGLSSASAWTISGVTEGLVLLTVLVAWCVEAALLLAWLSAIVGQLHAASTHAAHAGQELDQGTIAVAVAVPSIMVGAVYLGVLAVRVLHRRRREEAAHEAAAAEAERARIVEHRRTEQDAREARAAADRAHALELARLENERTQAARAAEQEAVRLAHEAAVQAAREAHEHEARMAELTRTQAVRKVDRAPRAPRRTAVRTPDRAPVETERALPQQADDLAVRRIVRGQWLARTEAGRKTPNAAVARTLGIEMGPARALVSRWKKDRAAAADSGAREAHAAPADTSTASAVNDK